LAGTKTHAVALHGTLGLREAAGLTEQLAEALAAHARVVVDATALDGADIALVQVLAAARRTAADAGRSLRLVAPPGGILAQLLARAGLAAPEGSAGDRFWTDTDAKGTSA
jgi:anti-anti-sigma regulatory factor